MTTRQEIDVEDTVATLNSAMAVVVNLPTLLATLKELAGYDARQAATDLEAAAADLFVALGEVILSQSE